MSRIYPISVGEPQSTAYFVKTDGAITPLYFARVSAVPFNRRWPGHQRPLDQTELASFALLESDGPAEIAVTPAKPFQQVTVRPLSKQITPAVDGNTVTFTVPGPGAYTVEFDGYHNALHLFVSPARKFEVDPQDENTIYFGRGIHEAGLIELHSGQTLFLDEGAVVHGRVYAKDADNIRILGHGILDASRIHEKFLFEFGEKEWEQFHKGFAVENAERIDTVILEYCDHVQIEGITIRDSLIYNIRPIACRDLQIDDVKIIGSWRYNSDGIDMHNCEQVRIRNCFIRTYDDSICVKGFDYRQNEADMLHDGYLHDVFRDVTVEKCVIWCDWGRALEIGAETRAREIFDITFRDCDVIHGMHYACDVQNVDYADVHGVTFENIRVEYEDGAPAPIVQKQDWEAYQDPSGGTFLYGLFGVYVTYIAEYSKGEPRRGINRDIRFRNIYVTAPRMPQSTLYGYDEAHQSRDITIEGLWLNGKQITDIRDANLFIGEHTSNIILK